MSTWNRIVSSGTITTPPPSPVREPIKPAASEPPKSAPEKSALSMTLDHGKRIFFRFRATVPRLGQARERGASPGLEIRRFPERPFPDRSENPRPRRAQTVSHAHQFL